MTHSTTTYQRHDHKTCPPMVDGYTTGRIMTEFEKYLAKSLKDPEVAAGYWESAYEWAIEQRDEARARIAWALEELDLYGRLEAMAPVLDMQRILRADPNELANKTAHLRSEQFACVFCGLDKRAASAGVLCEPPHGQTHTFRPPRPIRDEPRVAS